MNTTQKKPIGLFDSGIGGTSIWKEVHALLPNEKTIYLADSKNAPYGTKTKEEIIELCVKNTEKLLNLNCKIIIVACNTATTNAITFLRKKYKVPFIGIEPAIKPAAIKTKTKNIGLLATKGTLQSDLFSKTSELYTQNINVTEVTGTGLVELIENNQIDSDELHNLLIKYTQPFIENKIDYLVLGCSHYPYLIPKLQKILSKEVTIIDSGEAVAKQTKNLLLQNNLLNTETIREKSVFYTNANTKTLKHILKNYLSEIEIKKMFF